MKKGLKICLVTVAAGILFSAILLQCIPQRDVEITIPRGASAFQAAGILRREGLIISRTFFMVFLKISGGIDKIKAGKYCFPSRMLTPMIIKKLVKGKTILTRFTLTEGLTIHQTAELLELKGFGNADVYLNIFNERNLEGYLLPETYVMSQGLAESQIVDILVGQFERSFSEEWLVRAEDLNMTKKEVVILASIIEKEARVDHERPVISSVFHNRLKANRKLEMDATIQYALGKWKKRLYHKDLQVDSPYNTYKHYGLPPGPICSPGVKSIEAALFPAETKLLYYVSNGDGTHSFYEKYRDHLKGKKEYKKMIREYRKRQRLENRK